MNQFRIRLNKTNSVNSVNKDNMVDVEFQQTTNPYMFTTDIKDTIDQYEVFEAERANCTNYRLITTIKPFCSNVLFNPITEIVYKEGSDDCIVADDISKTEIIKGVDKIYGEKNPDRAQMIRDTEYSRKEINFEYHPGTDIFNNHILRNTSFKIVNPPNTTDNESREHFNTISDLLRRYDTKPIEYNKRSKINDTNNFKEKHLYDADDILSMHNGDAINNNIMEENGWFGFVNKSSVIAKKNENKGKWVDEGFNKVINNRESCEFIDMYPDRTLFSFNPKYNPYRHRPEYNWDLFLTYPYENDYNNALISGGLLIKSIELAFNSVGRRIVLFSTYTKHNLSIGTAFNLYIANKEKNNEVKVIKVENILVNSLGNVKKEDEEHYFYTTQTDIISQILSNNEEIDDDTDNDDINEQIKTRNVTFRLKHIVNGYESEYYIRKFKKLPNLNKIVNEEDKLTLDKSYCVNEFEKWIKDKPNDFDKEQYQLAFSSTIYNDNNTQVTWTDGINIDNILDNRGRPLTEIYLTIMKCNKGYSKWYENDDVKRAENVKSKEIEYSHCFGDVSWGFDLLSAKNEEEIILQEKLHDVKLIHNVNEDIVNDDEFNGDIVEYNTTTCNETILEDCYFRFNTYLRENPADYYTYQYDEIVSDDYDKEDFKVETRPLSNKNYLVHPEGYYYKAHYRILLKEFGEIHQESHFDLNIKNVAIRRNDMDNSTYVVVQTKLPHHLAANDKIMLCNDNTDEMVDIRVKSVINSNTFTFASINDELDARTVCDILNGKYDEDNITYSLKRYNSNIPFYAEKVDNTNRYLWRNVNNVGNKDNKVLPEYRFANGYFYIDQDINFFLKRQDPFNEFGLWYNGEDEDNILPNDIIGNILKESNYEYKEETEATC